MTSCARCGRDPIIAPAVASRMTPSGRVVAYYCHGDDDKDPTCYTLSQWAGFPEISEVLDAALRTGPGRASR